MGEREREKEREGESVCERESSNKTELNFFKKGKSTYL